MNIQSGTFAALLCGTAMNLQAATWSSTEAHLQYGDLTNAFTGEDERTTIITLQHASGWQYGENFFFIDHITTEGGSEFYGEWYPFFSAGKLFSSEFGGPIRDMGFVAGVNAAPDANVIKYLPGLQVNWNIPGFAFFNTLLTAYIDDTQGDIAPKEDDSFMIDVAWKYPFNIGSQSFSIEGHMEYIDGRDFSDIDGSAESWILAQPQIRWDLGKALWDAPNQLHAGVELQYWRNKLGTQEDENAVQFLVVWGL